MSYGGWNRNISRFLSVFINLSIYIYKNFRSLRVGILLLDNVLIHLTENTKRVEVKYNMNILGLSPFWTHSAQIEFVFEFLNVVLKENIDFFKKD